MALPEHAPHIPHIPVPDLRGGLKWAIHHWPAVGGAALTAAGAGLAYQMLVGQDRGSSVPPPEPNKASDTFKPPEGGANVGIVPIPAAEPTSTAEAQKPFNNGLISPNAYKGAEYIQWNNLNGVKFEGMGLTLAAGEDFRIPEDMQVAATERLRNGKPNGYRIAAVRKDGSMIEIYGDSIPNGLSSVGKDLPAGTVVAASGGSGVTFVDKYAQVIIFSSSEDLKRFFPDQTQLPAKTVTLSAASISQPSPQGATFFDVKPSVQQGR